MPTTETQTDTASFPTNKDLKSRWFFGLPDEGGTLPNAQLGLSSFSFQVDSEYDLVDEDDIDPTLTEEDDPVVVLNRSGIPISLPESSESGSRILMHRGAYSLRRMYLLFLLTLKL